MKKLFFLFALIPYVLYSQNSIGVGGGITMNSIFKQQEWGAEAKYSYYYGVNGEFLMAKKLFFSAEFDFYSKGYTQLISLYGSSGEEVLFRYMHTFDYITIPMMVKFSGSSKQFGYIGLGLAPSFLLSYIGDRPIISDELKEIGRKKLNFTEGVSGFDLTGVLNLGFGFKIKEKFQVCFDFKYNPSLISVKEEYISTFVSERWHNSGCVGILLKYLIKNKDE